MRRLVHKKAKRRRNKPVVHHKMHITRGDTVRVVSGDDKGREGRVLQVDRKKYRVTVEGVNIVKRHKRAQREGEESGIIEFPAMIDASNVMLLDPKSGEPTRIRRKRDKDGVMERISVKSGQAIPRA
jgi:large subunit ribosomal protein L24